MSYDGNMVIIQKYLDYMKLDETEESGLNYILFRENLTVFYFTI